ncbi:MAG: argonaute/piwi family protein [Beijerinckiaceae bacterium]
MPTESDPINQASANAEAIPDLEKGDQLILSLDAFVRSIGVRRMTPFAMFLGAGASTSSGIPSAQMCIWEWKRQIFLTNNPGLEEQFAELSLDGVRRRIQLWLDRQEGYPRENTPEEYGFYIRQCFPISDDRRAYFAELVRHAMPHVGYRLLCHLAEADLIRSVWSPNFDSLPARAAANFKLSPIEVGIDTQNRANRMPRKGELLCVSMHGDYRYDQLKNTPEELQQQEAALRAALVSELRDTSLVVSGYSGRDRSLMDSLHDAYAQAGSGILYWCGFSDSDTPAHVGDLIQHARSHGRQAYYVPTLGFDDLLTRVGLHCLQGDARKSVIYAMEQFAPEDKLTREPFHIMKYQATTLIKSNSFVIECPSELLRFDLKQWPEENVWTSIRERTQGFAIVAVPFKGKIFALGLIDVIKEAFGDNINGPVERTPVGPKDLTYEDSAIVSLMREALTRSMAEAANLGTDSRRELWKAAPREDQRGCKPGYVAFDSVHIYLRRIGGTQYLVLMPSIKVVDKAGAEAPLDIANPIKLAILGYQHNKPFNRAVLDWRSILFPQSLEADYEFPPNCGSSFRFKVRRSPVFGEIGLPQGGKITKLPAKYQPLVKYTGVQLAEPELVFSNRAGTALVRSPHPIRGIVENRPFDYPLTARGFLTGLRLGVICPAGEAKALHSYLHNVNRILAPTQKERDYLVNYPGFQSAYGVPIEFPQPGEAGWFVCPEPSSTDPHTSALEIARHIDRGVETLQSSYAPHVVMIFYPSRWREFRGYRTDSEHFDVHDFVKAFCVQRGIATQFLDEDTFADSYQCRVWWWLSLALYVKAMRTPWVLSSLAEDTAFVGLGFSIDPVAEKGRHVVLGCSHIYSGKGEGLQYRLTKVENPVFFGKNPFMSKDDARRTGETIRQLFFDARLKLPERVVLHKRTHFTKDEREGLADGLSGVKHIDMLEIQIDNALRYVASVPKGDGTFDDDNYPVRRGTAMKLDDFTALLWVHGATTALNSRYLYFQGKRRIPAPLTVRRHAGRTDLKCLAEEILGLSKMNWNTLDLYTKLPATVNSSNEIARIGSLLHRFGAASYDYRLFI